MYSSAVDETLAIIGSLFAFFVIFYIVILAAALASYLLQAFAILNMSRQRGLENGWFGFIPFLSAYQLGTIAEEIEIGNKKITNPGFWMVVAPFIYFFFFTVGYLAMMIPIFMSAARLESSYYYEPSAVAGLISSLIIGMFVFAILLIVAQVFLYLVLYLVYHKIFSQYVTGQKPVYYLILSMFVPLALPIILYKLSKKPLLEAPLGVDGGSYQAPSAVHPQHYEPAAQAAYQPEVIVEQVVAPMVEPVSEPAVEPVAPVVEPIAEPAVEPVTEPAEDPIAEPVVEQKESADESVL